VTKWVWISFDLGVNGDYEGMYAWLDDHDAKECADSVAHLQYESRGDIVAELREEIRANVQLTPRSRVYVIYRGDDTKMKGTWLVGKRKQAPWTGYGSLEDEGGTDES
jgi:hypothetical protein